MKKKKKMRQEDEHDLDFLCVESNDMSEEDSRRQGAFTLLGWFGRASRRAMQAMKSFVSCTSLASDDSNFEEYITQILHPEPTASSPASDGDSFSHSFATNLRDPSPLRGGSDPPLKPCDASDDSFAEYLTNAIRSHNNTLDFRDHSTELSTCSMPKSDGSQYLKRVVGSSFKDASTCSILEKETPLCYATPPDGWSNRKGGKSPVGFVGKMGPNTSTRLAAICKSQKTQIFERPPPTAEGSDSGVTSTYSKIVPCQCIKENIISSVSSAQPKLPANFFDLPTKVRLRAAKQFLEEFEYRLNSMSNFQVKKMRPLSGLMATAKLIIHRPEPIKCVEAVFIALFLTAGLQSVERIPLGFKTQFANQVFQHVVLLVQHRGKYGALGTSRSPDLMNKDIRFDSMSSIIEDFLTAYEETNHTIINLQIGLPVEHNIMSANFVCWEHLLLYPAVQPWPECVAAIENHALRMKHLWNVWVISGRGADPTRKPSKGVRKAPLNDGHKRVNPTIRKVSTLRKPHRVHMKQFEQQISVCHQTRAPFPPRIIRTLLQPVCSGTTNSNKSLLKGPWNYRHDQGTTCKDSSLQEDGNEKYSVNTYTGSVHEHMSPWEVRKNCSPFCKADSKLIKVDNYLKGDSYHPKGRGSGPLYNMALKRSRAG